MLARKPQVLIPAWQSTACATVLPSKAAGLVEDAEPTASDPVVRHRVVAHDTTSSPAVISYVGGSCETRIATLISLRPTWPNLAELLGLHGALIRAEGVLPRLLLVGAYFSCDMKERWKMEVSSVIDHIAAFFQIFAGYRFLMEGSGNFDYLAGAKF